jgi:ribosomal protein S4
MFSRRLPSVVNMDPAYMAKYDGSEQASGRGSGRKEVASEKADRVLESQRMQESGNAKGEWKKKTPYMQLTFAPMERRLDIAIFRALFASSARQARQFCVHGAVKVNGKKVCMCIRLTALSYDRSLYPQKSNICTLYR